MIDCIDWSDFQTLISYQTDPKKLEAAAESFRTRGLTKKGDALEARAKEIRDRAKTLAMWEAHDAPLIA